MLALTFPACVFAAFLLELRAGPCEGEVVEVGVGGAPAVLVVLGAILDGVGPADGRDVMLDSDNEVIPSDDVNDDIKTDCSERMLLNELSPAASKEGL